MDTMKEFRYFTIVDHEKEEEYLREQHRRGWKFTYVSGFGMYHFERCEPADVIYRLDYNPEAKKDRSAYIRLFADCGWEYLQEYVQYSYFRKDAAAEGADDIFCDDESRLEMFGHVFRGRMIPLLVIFFALLVPMMIMQLHNGYPLGVILYAAILALYLLIFALFACKYFHYRKRIKK